MPRPTSPLIQALAAGVQGFQSTYFPRLQAQFETEEKLRLAKAATEIEEQAAAPRRAEENRFKIAQAQAELAQNKAALFQQMIQGGIDPKVARAEIDRMFAVPEASLRSVGEGMGHGDLFAESQTDTDGPPPPTPTQPLSGLELAGYTGAGLGALYTGTKLAGVARRGIGRATSAVLGRLRGTPQSAATPAPTPAPTAEEIPLGIEATPEEIKAAGRARTAAATQTTRVAQQSIRELQEEVALLQKAQKKGGLAPEEVTRMRSLLNRIRQGPNKRASLEARRALSQLNQRGSISTQLVRSLGSGILGTAAAVATPEITAEAIRRSGGTEQQAQAGAQAAAFGSEAALGMFGFGPAGALLPVFSRGGEAAAQREARLIRAGRLEEARDPLGFTRSLFIREDEPQQFAVPRNTLRDVLLYERARREGRAP